MSKTKPIKTQRKDGISQRILFVLGIVMFVNALSYGTIIPLLYPYATHFGMAPSGLGLLFASFSIAQLFATPIIGRLSDRFGRKPLLLICLFGTAVSLILFASAQSLLMLYVARILDGVTGGNNSVAQAVIADSFEGKDRAKGFGVLGALFGVGFVVGPALGALLSPIGITAPFWFASGLAMVGTIIGLYILPETLPKVSVKRHVSASASFSLNKIITAFSYPVIGLLLILSMMSQLSHSVFVIGFQSFTVDILSMATLQIGLLFSGIGLLSAFAQIVVMPWLLKMNISQVELLKYSFAASTLVLVAVAFQQTILGFTVVSLLYPLVFSPQLALISALISTHSMQADQGGILGLNQSCISLGQAIGPLITAGALVFSPVYTVFILAAIFFGVSWSFSQRLNDKTSPKFDL